MSNKTVKQRLLLLADRCADERKYEHRHAIADAIRSIARDSEAELQALSDRVAKLEAAGNAMDATLLDELLNLEEGDAEMGQQQYVDPEMAIRIIAVRDTWYAAKSA